MQATRTVPFFLGRSKTQWALLAMLSLVLLGSPRDAHAQATSWLYVGGGAGALDRPDGDSHPLLQVDSGFGTSATHPLVVGGMFRAQGYFGAGVDLAIVSRLVTRGFARGGFGGGIDAGVYQRWWGEESRGFIGNLVLGAPWGLTLVAGLTAGTGDQQLYFASIGLDLARLTVHRQTGLDWFPNPMRSPAE
jgi:hypothetical protein